LAPNLFLFSPFSQFASNLFSVYSKEFEIQVHIFKIIASQRSGRSSKRKRFILVVRVVWGWEGSENSIPSAFIPNDQIIEIWGNLLKTNIFLLPPYNQSDPLLISASSKT
jgi:hypothetical protein